MTSGGLVGLPSRPGRMGFAGEVEVEDGICDGEGGEELTMRWRGRRSWYLREGGPRWKKHQAQVFGL